MSGKPTEAQTRARQRNWQIRCIRSLWAQAGHLSEPFRTSVREAIDADLMERGAEPERVRRERYVTETEIPF
ncbi:hypothetical protein GCM10011329_22860 [Stakelama pacifica]|nr:hypothetical protein GCM10011329_22860 [Stakelama pacifica]